MENKKDITVVLGTYNRKNFLKLTINSIREELDNSNLTYEIIVVDGGSNDGTIKWLTKQKDIISIIQHNRGIWNKREIERRSWGYFMNLGFKCAQGKYICMLSDDCLVVPDAIINGIELFENKLSLGEKIGAIAFFWRNWPKQKDYWVGYTLGNNMMVNHGIFLNEALKEVNYIDEESFRFYCADGDLCLKLKQSGYECIKAEDSYIEHYAHATNNIKAENFKTAETDLDVYLKKWKKYYAGCSHKNRGYWEKKEFFDQTKTEKHFKIITQKNIIICVLEKVFKKLKLLVTLGKKILCLKKIFIK